MKFTTFTLLTTSTLGQRADNLVPCTTVDDCLNQETVDTLNIDYASGSQIGTIDQVTCGYFSTGEISEDW